MSMQNGGLRAAIVVLGLAVCASVLPAPPVSAGSGPVPQAYDNTFAKDFIMDAPWRVIDADTPIPVTIVLKDCDTDDIRQLHWIRCWDVTGGGSTLLWDHDFGDERIGNDPSEDNYWTYITTVTEGHGALPDNTLLTPANLGYGAGEAIQLKVSVYYRDDFFNYTDSRVLRVHVGSGPFPWPDDWYGGDTHYHTMYTNNLYEFGAPLPAVRMSAIAMGLHWLTVTDHSCDLDETGDGTYSYATHQWEYTIQSPSGIQTVIRDVGAEGGTWESIQADIDDLASPDFRAYRGVEINLASIDADSWEKTLHTLFYNPDYVHSPDCGAIGERPVSPSLPAGMAQLGGGGFAYASHPLSDLATEFGGIDFGVNGARWGDQDLQTALTYEAFRGLEAFNTRITRHSNDQNDPWSDFDAGVLPDDPYPNELLAGIALWDELLRGGLNGTTPRKMFLSGGSDAHGDFNYSSHLGLDSYADDSAMGKVQTVAYVPGPYAAGNLPPIDAIMAAFRAGRTVVTDGPFLEIGIDKNGDGDWTDPDDLRIGDDGVFGPSTVPPLHLRWTSLVEFGPVVSLRVLAGDELATDVLLSIDPSGSGEGYSGSTQIDLEAVGLLGAQVLRAELLTEDGDTGHRAFTNPIWIYIDPVTEVGEDPPLLTGGLDVLPNPFHGSTRIRYVIEESESGSVRAAERITLTIYDVTGKRVRRLLDDVAQSPGVHEIDWDGTDEGGDRVSSGSYFYRLVTQPGGGPGSRSETIEGRIIRLQ